MDNENRITWLITEYQELRKEIERRSKEQFLCVSGSIIALGSVVGFIAKSPLIYSPLLIIVPWILAIFGIIWVDHAHHISLLGSYIREKIENQINLLDYQGDIGWQSHIKSFRGKSKLPSFIVCLLPFLYFIFPSINCIFAYIIMRLYKCTKLPVYAEIPLIVIGTVFLIILFVGWIRAVRVIPKK
jgi:hypothetical protein